LRHQGEKKREREKKKEKRKEKERKKEKRNIIRGCDNSQAK